MSLLGLIDLSLFAGLLNLDSSNRAADIDRDGELGLAPYRPKLLKMGAGA